MKNRKNIFSSLLKYSSSNNLTPKENFSTEALVYLLNLSIDSDRLFFKYFISLINEKISIKEDSIITISTQCKYRSSIQDYEIDAIPDIAIIINGLHIFIEVKIDSDINEYQCYNEEKMQISYYNQLEKYDNIILNPNNKIIAALTIFPLKIQTKSSYQSITWNDISRIIDNYETISKDNNILFSEFNNYLKHENMAMDKVTNSINRGLEDVLNLMLQIRTALKVLDLSYTSSVGETYNGFYVDLIAPQKIKLWIGLAYITKSIKIQIINKDELIEYLKNQTKYRTDPNSKSYYLVDDIQLDNSDYIDLSKDEQYERIKNWIDTNINDLMTLF